jgi:RNA polymerase sigma-70 factor (ECF subfamily)
MDSLRALHRRDDEVTRSENGMTLSDPPASFRAEFVALFDGHFPRLYRYLDRLSGEPELAADLAQEAFVRLYRRGTVPDAPEAWLISVAMNLYRNVKASRSRRRRLLTVSRGEGVHSDPPRRPDESSEGDDARRRVRSVLDRMTERERHLLLLRAEGYSYRDIAAVLRLNEASVGVLLARAKRVFRESYEDAFDAS